jgi:hypothetical protein
VGKVEELTAEPQRRPGVTRQRFFAPDRCCKSFGGQDWRLEVRPVAVFFSSHS